MDSTIISGLSYDDDSFTSGCESETSEECVVDETLEEVYAQQGIYKENQAEDKKLRNWSRWLGDRQKQYGRLKTTLNKDPLIMKSDNIYEKKHKERLIESANTYVIFDKYRGDPKFWKTPDYVYDDDGEQVPVNCPVQDHFDRTVLNENKPPDLEYIGIPLLVQREKGLLQLDKGFKKRKKTFHKCNYYLDRKRDLDYNVNLIDKFAPDMDYLYVAGRRYPCESSVKYSSVEDCMSDATIIVHLVRGLRDCVVSREDTRFPMLKIQGNLIDPNVMNSLKGDFEQVVDFLDCSVNRLYLKNLVIENVGNVCVRYSWIQVEPYRNPIIPLRYSTQLVKRFFFPEKSDISLPGQITKLPFCFKSREPGVYQETWMLTTDPKFSKDKSIKFSLQGFARVQLQREKLLKIESYIKKCQLATEASKLLDGVFVDSKLQNPIPYDSLFYFKDVFLHNNPNFFYESEVVGALQELYEAVAGDSKWDLNMTTLRNVIVNKNESVEEKRQHLTKFYELSRSLLKYNVDFDIDNEKYRAVYQILCSFANSMERDATQLRAVYRLDATSSLPSVNTSNERSSDMNVAAVKSKSGSRRLRNNSSTSAKRKSRSSQVKQMSIIPSTGSSFSDAKEISGSTESISAIDTALVQYVKTLSIKTYQHLLTAVDEIAAVIESLNMFSKPQ